MWRLLMQQKRHLALALVSLLICVSMNLLSPVLQGMLFDVLVRGQHFSEYSKLFLGLLFIYVAEPLLSQVYILNACAAGEKLQASLRLEAFRCLLAQRVEFFDRHSSSRLTQLLSRDLDSIRAFVFTNSARDRGPRALLEALGSVAVLFALSWRLGPILAAVIVASVCTAFLYRRQTRALEATSAAAQQRLAEVASSSFANMRTVRIFAGEALEQQRFGQQVARSYASGLGFARAKAMLEGINRSATHLSLLALYALGGHLVNNKLLPVGVLVTSIGFTFSLVFATQGMLQTFADLRGMVASVRRVRATLSELPPDESMAQALPPLPEAPWEYPLVAPFSNGDGPLGLADEGPVPVGAANGSHVVAGEGLAVAAAQCGDLRLEGISFSYPVRPGAPVLKDLSLTLPRGKVTALVGRSGAGKSTVAALLERLYTPDAGSITLGGADIRAFTRGEWCGALAAVSQEPVLFPASIAYNIGYGRSMQCTQAEIEAAARAANAHEFIAALPEGYATVVGEAGSLLSGGQRQRIALARALLKDAPILILDEATSSLDVENERLVQAAIEKLMEGRTVMVIAHRLSTVQNADQIVVLEAGQVVEQGTHKQLLQRPGRYSALVSAQELTLQQTLL
ncbi:hypothetical protein CHLNCDRAFT_31851 [Chlorella variabilis]|uniref:ABC transporter ATP-binding protein n=1 Tax=Chlorella variabilis TaxID=554065 RepID=E1ZJ47_CHLVA|nr:hypothetical protein CHLNCDRAFT_31851 [Chlorella variabilis]EFN54275.1 hypothetical protein CHLNCDRAFT_31851 [Chlorella variabilis]|eukprot:XP_005846377.1 hypothetical protein CHLNCDRAFT_31851 [Chlorella variabilis]